MKNPLYLRRFGLKDKPFWAIINTVVFYYEPEFNTMRVTAERFIGTKLQSMEASI